MPEHFFAIVYLSVNFTPAILNGAVDARRRSWNGDSPTFRCKKLGQGYAKVSFLHMIEVVTTPLTIYVIKIKF